MSHPTPGMVSTSFPLATSAGAEMLRRGGNAVDAAVAAAWALSVCEPGNSGLGGQSIVLLRQPSGECMVLDGHSQGPAAASLETVPPDQQRTGPRACTVPSTPAVLEEIHRQHGRLPWSTVLEPAIELADEGYLMTPLQNQQLIWCLEKLSRSATGSRFFLQDGKPIPVGATFRQPELAGCLKRISRLGADDFYRGEIAQGIDSDMREQGGLITLADLTEVKPVQREPLHTEFESYDLLTTPPPAGGFLVLLGLKILEQIHRDVDSVDLIRWYEVLGETIHIVFSVRESLPLRLEQLELEELEALLEERACELGQALESGTYRPATGSKVEEAGETTHLCAVDGEGIIVSLTQSIQSLYGSKTACSKYGFLFNNYLVTCPREPHPHQLGSRCQPRSNSAPSVLLPTGSSSEELITFGASGSRRSISAVLHTLSGLLDRGLSLPEAVALPRIHIKQSRHVWLETFDRAEEIQERIAHSTVEVEMRKRLSYAMGCLQAIRRTPTGQLEGAADPRREGTVEEVRST